MLCNHSEDPLADLLGKVGQLWFYQAALAAFKEAGFSGSLLDELERVVGRLVRAAA